MSPKVRNGIMIGVIASVFIAAAILLIVGITTHDEPGFLHDDKRWSGVPLGVHCSLYVDGVGDCGAVERVAGQINDRLGFELLRYGAGSDVDVTLGVPSEMGWIEPGGVAEIHWTAERITGCDVRVVNTGTDEMRDLVIEHELGHCLGLAHDDFDSSIMRPTQRPTPNGQFPPRITDHDREILRERYLGE